MKKFELGGYCNNGHLLTEEILGTRKKWDRETNYCRICKRAELKRARDRMRISASAISYLRGSVSTSSDLAIAVGARPL